MHGGDGEWEGEADMSGVRNRSVLTAAAGR